MSEPATVAQLPVLRLKRNEDRRLQAGHLWVFSNEVDTEQTPLTRFAAGELVRVLAHNDRALGLAYVNPRSLISARMLSTWQPPDAAWFAARLRVALQLRERLYAEPYYRLAYGESDGLPGLVVDRYGTQCVVQIGTAGMELLKPHIQAAVLEVLRPEGLLFKNDSGSRELEGLPTYLEVAKGRFDEVGLVIEDGLELKLQQPAKFSAAFDALAQSPLTKVLDDLRGSRGADIGGEQDGLKLVERGEVDLAGERDDGADGLGEGVAGAGDRFAEQVRDSV